MEAQAKDQVVLREIFTQEAEKKGIAASADYRAQMELARQSILIRELFEDFKKKNPVSDAEAKAEYDKFKASSPVPNTAPATSWWKAKTRPRR